MTLALSIDNPQLLQEIRNIGYVTMFILMVIEGPIITLVSAFAASLGWFNIFGVFLLSMLGDITGDVLLYGIGYWGGNKALKWFQKITHVQSKTITKLENLFHRHGVKIIFAVKSTTGLCWITFVAAGSVRMKLKSFLLGSVSGGVIWSGLLVTLGYFFGFAFLRINDYIRYAGVIIFVTAVTLYLAINFYKKWQGQKLLEEKNSEM